MTEQPPGRSLFVLLCNILFLRVNDMHCMRLFSLCLIFLVFIWPTGLVLNQRYARCDGARLYLTLPWFCCCDRQA